MSDEEQTLEGYSQSAGGQFLKASDVEMGKTLQKQVRETGWYTDPDGVEKPTLLFEDETTLVLNKTNAGYLVAAGFTFETLPGVIVSLGQLMTMYNGVPTPGLRIVGAETKAA